MTRLLRAFLLLLAMVGAAVAQGTGPGPADSPGVPIGREKDRIRMVPRDPGSAPGAETPKEEEKAPPPEDEDPFTANVRRLGGWPSGEARAAAVALALLGPEIEPKLIALLPRAEPPLAAGLCVVLGDIGGDEALAAVQRVAGLPAMSEFLPEIFEVLGRLDGENAIKRVLPFLRHPKRPAREAAELWLRSRLNASFVPRLVETLSDTNRGARLSALRLLGGLDPAQARASALGLLGDEAPEVARFAAETLAHGADDAVVADLNRAAGGAAERPAAYAMLALVLYEERIGRRAYEEATLAALLGRNGLRSPEKLNRGIAAVALADIGYDSQIPAVDAVLDQTVVPVLLDTVGGQSYFKDYSSIAELARDRFGKMTGIRERTAIPELWKFWADNKDGFVARRALRDIAAESLGSLRVRARSLVTPALPTTLFSAVAADAGKPEVSGIDFVHLLPGDVTALADLLTREVLSLPGGAALPAAKAEEFGPEVQITISVNNRSRTVSARDGAVPDGVRTALLALLELRGRYAWQRFWDRARYPAYEAFIREESAFFASDPAPEARALRLKALILGALDDLATADERLTALRMLSELPVPYTDTDAYRLATLLDAEAELSPYAERLAEVLGRTGRPLIVPILADWLARHPGPHGLAIFSDALARLGAAETERAAGSDLEFVRRGAMAAGPAAVPPDRLLAHLTRGTRDDSPAVRREACLALGASRLDGALPLLDAATRDPDVEAAGAALSALGALGRPEVVPLLLRELASEDAARRVTVVEALCASALPEALPPVLTVLTDDPSPLVRGVAAREVARFGDAALRGVSAIVMDPKADAEVRARAVETLARIGRDHVSDVLEALLADPADAVADAAAFALASRANKAGVPRILAALEAGRNPVRAVEALEQVSSQSFPGARPEELPSIYRGWWSEHRNEPESAWFGAALRERGAPEEAAVSLLAGKPDANAVPALLSALSDPAWFVRANANLWLARLSGKDMGEITRHTAAEEVRAVEARWRALWGAR